MARMPSRTARCGYLLVLASAAALLVQRASAEPGMTVSRPANVVENPFADRSAQSRPAPARPVGEPATTEGEPKHYRNPFSGRTTPPRARLQVPRTGAAGRWRRPPRVPASPSARQPSATADSNVRPASDAWDTLSDGDFRAADPAVFEEADSPWSLRSSTPPDPAKYNAHGLEQPPWLLPRTRGGPDATSNRSAVPAAGPAARPTHVDRSAGQPLPRPLAPAPTFVDQQGLDPFDHGGGGFVEVADGDAGGSTAAGDIAFARPKTPATDVTTPPSDAPNTGALYVAAQRAAESAASPEDFSRVVQLCQQGLARRPRRELAESLRSLAAWACNARGEIFSDVGEAREAASEFNTAIEFDPNCWLALHNRAISRAQRGQVEAALGDFNRVIQLNPGLATAYRNRGELLGVVGRTEEAVADYSRALAQLSDDADLYDMRGHALHRLGRYQESIDDLDRSIELRPDNAEAFTHRGNVYAELGDFGSAIDDLRQALAVDADCGGAYRSLAWLMATCPDRRYRDPQQAVAAAERAARLSPRGDPFVLDALAAAYASAGQFEPAVRYQTEAIAVAPESFAPQFSSRLALYRHGRPFRNGQGGAGAADEVRAASLESTARHPTANRAH